MSPLPSESYRWITRAFVKTFGIGGLLLGLAMIAAGPTRFSSPGLATARLVPGGVYSWGSVMVAAGVITLLGVIDHWRRNVVVVGMFLQAVWFLFFTISLVSTAVRSPTGAVTGPIVYTMLGVLAVIAAVGGRSSSQ